MATQQPEFSRSMAVDRFARSGERIKIEANAVERAALAERFGIVALDRLVATIEVEPRIGGRGFHVTSALQADVVQSCVVSLEPVPAHIDDEISQLFAEVPESGTRQAAADPGDEVDEEAEPIVDGLIDLGEMVAQQLAVALPPYPRAPDAAINSVVEALPEGVSLCIEDENAEGGDVDEPPAGPFAALARLKGNPRRR
jgi:uncharacterized metal-binding protein YceD (DUF177 family)